MNNVIIMQILQPTAHISNNSSRPLLIESPLFLKSREQGAISRIFHHHVDVLLVVEDFVEGQQVSVLYEGMDFYLSEDVLF